MIFFPTSSKLDYKLHILVFFFDTCSSSYDIVQARREIRKAASAVETTPVRPPTGSPGCGELGYLSLSQQGSHLFFQVLSQRSQRTSTVMIADLPFAEGRKPCDSMPEALAIADRLAHRSEVLTLGGMRYRSKLSEHHPSCTTQGLGLTLNLTSGCALRFFSRQGVYG